LKAEKSKRRKYVKRISDEAYMEAVRRAAVAGTWYAGQAARLAADVDRYIAEADVKPLPGLRAVIAPHAGLMYSGPVAAFAYKAARRTPYATVVMIGPSHFVPFRGVSIWPRGAWDTPFGPAAVDDSLAAAITRAGDGAVIERPDAHDREHSLELQLPFIAHLWPQSRIVPLVMGQQTRDTAFAVGDALAQALAGRDDVLLVASSDLSHYEDAATAVAMDRVVMRYVEALDPDGLMAALEREPRHACGGGPIVATLLAARQLGADRARLLHYADSGDVSGDKSSVVGYMAAAIW
jgi:AmmeMemoRadiSam system protein B